MHRIPILHKRMSNGEIHHGKLVIGVLGTHKGAGVTHFSVLLANYLSEWLGRKTAYVEYYPQKNIQYLREYIYGKSEVSQTGDTFLINRVTYYSNVKEQVVAEIIGDSYECIILDLGTDLSRSKNEFLRCDNKIIVSSLALWKRHELELFLSKTSHIKSNELWNIVIPFGQMKELKQAAKEYDRNIYGVPYEPDPFALSEDIIQLFGRLI